MTRVWAINDELYRRLTAVADERPYPATAKQELEKALERYLDIWEPFFFDGPAAAQRANATQAADNTPARLWDGGPSY